MALQRKLGDTLPNGPYVSLLLHFPLLVVRV